MLGGQDELHPLTCLGHSLCLLTLRNSSPKISVDQHPVPAKAKISVAQTSNSNTTRTTLVELLLPSEISQAKHSLSSFISTLLYSKLSYNSPACYKHSIAFPAKCSNCFNNPPKKVYGQAHHSNTPFPWY